MRPIAVTLGTATWPAYESLDNPAFERSADAFKRYLTNVLGIEERAVLDTFGSAEPASHLLVRIGEFLERHASDSPDALLIYYVGHGEYVGDTYRLMVADTRRGYEDGTSLSLSALDETLRRFRSSFPEIVIVDACFAGAAVSTFRRPRSGLGVALLAAASSADSPRATDQRRSTPFTEALVAALEEGDASRPRLLTLADVRDLTHEVLSGVEGSVRPELHDPEQRQGEVSAIPLFPNAAWPGRPRTPSNRRAVRPWSLVLSSADDDRRLLEIAAGEMAIKSGPDIVDAFGWTLAEVPATVRADAAARSPRDLARAVRNACEGDLAFFDLTGLEPVVVLLLGIRSVVRRGVTVCSTAHDAAEIVPPFHLREVRLASHHPDLTGRPPEDALAERALAGLRDLHGAPQHYADLPSFDPLRAPPPQPLGPTPRTVEDGEVLILCSFGDGYTRRNWRQLQQTISARMPRLMRRSSAADGRPREARVARSVDLRSPRIVSPALYEAMRLTEFCVVDLTEWRPNVLFELGVRLAASPVMPIVILSTDDSGGAASAGQQHALAELFEPIRYDPDDARNAAEAMLERHLATRSGRLDSSPQLALQRTALRVYQEAWGLSDAQVEPVSPSAVERLRDAARQLLADQTTGVRPGIYPATHPLSELAESNGVEHLVAAWLYLTRRVDLDSADDDTRTEAFNVGSELVVRLAASNRTADEDLAGEVFVALQRLRRRGEASMALEDVLEESALLRRLAKAYTGRGYLAPATDLLNQAIVLLRPQLEVQRARRPWSGTTVRLASALADTYGQLGGVHRREDRLDEALEAYRAGSRIEREPMFGLINSYNSTNEHVLEFLLSRETSAEARGRLHQALRWTRDQAAGPRREDWWVWADIGVLCVLAGYGDDALAAYTAFREAGARRTDIDSARPVVAEISVKAGALRQDVAVAAEAALHLLDELRVRPRAGTR